MATFYQFRKAIAAFLNKEADWNSDNIYAALLGAGYTPNLDTDDYWNDISANEIANGNGYTTNGQLLTGCTITYTPANSWATTWAATTAFALNDVIRPTSGNGYLYRAKAAGTTGGSAPTWPTTIGGEVTDGTVTWECVGTGDTVINANSPSWGPSSNITARYVAIYDRSPGSDAARPLIGLIDQGAAVTSVNAAWSVTFNAQGLMHFFALQ